MKYLSLLTLVFVISFFFQGLFAQDLVQKSVRIDIAHNGLHCPFLGPQLKEKISQLNGAENVNLNSHDSYIEFDMPSAKTPSEEDLIKMANDLGYPKEDIKITIKSLAAQE